MKKIIIIYAIGVVLGWGMGVNYLKNSLNRPLIYRDIAFASGMSTLSWINVAALSVLHLEELDIWDKEVKLN
jgi:hypothetical protein